MSEDFSKMTVLELRRVAKDMGVVLGAGISKQGIVDKLNAAKETTAAPVSTPPAAAPAASSDQRRPVRSASIIADDGYDDHDDIPVLTPNRGFTPRKVIGAPRAVPARPAAPTPAAAPASPRASSLSSISSKAPAFTMEGSRTWHNPRAYQAQQGYQQPRTPQYTGISNRPLPTAGGEARPFTRAPRPDMTPRTPPVQPYTPHFGPDLTQTAEPTPAAPEERPPLFRNEAPANDYRPMRDYRPDAVSEYPPRESAPYAQPAQPVGQAGINEVLAAGECGDGEGVLELLPDGFGFLRAEHYLAGRKDIYISNAQVKRFGLRSGDYIVGKTRKQRDNDRFAAMLFITDVNGKSADEPIKRPLFEELTPIYPKKRFVLSGKDATMTLKLIDVLSPIGFGQRALIVSPQRAGRINLLVDLSKTLTAKYPDVTQMMLLIDQRPEDVTEIREQVRAEVVSSSFDEPPESQTRASELLLERAMRLAECGGNVVLLLDSITRLTYAYNAIAPATARTTPSGLAAGAMNKPKRLFGAARNLKQGGSLTVVATALAETGNPIDEAVLKELKGTSNMEAQLLMSADKRVYPTLSVENCATRHDELLLSDKEIEVAKRLREMLASGDPDKAEFVYAVIDKTRDTKDLAERFDGLADMLGK